LEYPEFITRGAFDDDPAGRMGAFDAEELSRVELGDSSGTRNLREVCRRTWSRGTKWTMAQRIDNARARADGNLTETGWQLTVKAHDRCCAYCGQRRKLVIEHVRPVSRGGRTDVDNIVPACAACNSAKGTKLPEEWLSPIEYKSFLMRRARADAKREQSIALAGAA
jgi:5-methylcytosine-specific restriction endonuclease McrA